MTSGVPWQVEGVRPQARETAQEAARRAGMSVGEWLDAVISDSAQGEADEPSSLLAGLLPDDDQHAADIDERAPGGRNSGDYHEHNRHRPAEDLAGVSGRLDEVGRRLEQLSQLNANQAYLRPDLRAEEPPRELSDVISNLDRRLDQLIAWGRSAGEKVEQRVSAIDREAANRERPAPAPVGDPST